MHALIFGATGTAGSAVLTKCLAHPEIQRVTVLHRRSTEVSHPKLQERMHADFTDYSGLEPLLASVDICFFCLGISQVKERNREQFYRITHDYPVEAARALMAANPEVTFCFLSGKGADPTGRSAIPFAAVKGLAEQSLRALGLKRLHIFRPGYIHPDAAHPGRIWGERLSGFLYPLLKVLTPGFVVHVNVLADAMIRVALHGHEQEVLDNNDIKRAVGKEAKS